MQITYQKSNGSIMQKYRNTLLPYKIGDTTSMGWKVLNIEYKYKDKFYPEYKYHILIHKEKQRCTQRKLAIELCIKEVKNLLYCIIAVLIISILKNLLGI